MAIFDEILTLTFPIFSDKAHGGSIKSKIGDVMVSREKCAFLRKDGVCLLHHGQCTCNVITSRCPDGVRHAKPHPSMDERRWVDMYDMRTSQGRMRFATRNTRRGEVYAQCSKKMRYPTEYRAREVARRRTRSGSGELRVYRCHFCGGYHLTSHIDIHHDEVAA